jgi:transcription termination factor Rho
VLELHPKGYGFLRNPARHYAAQANDPYVPAPLIQRFALREGLHVTGPTEPPRQGTGPRLAGVGQIEGHAPEQFPRRDFDDLTPIDPHEHIVLETGAQPLTTRVMDLLTPIGKGQRGLIVAPPRTGKTVLLQHIAAAVSANHPEMHLMVLLVDERPEEVTEIRRTVKGEVIASSSDRDAVSHVRTAELVMERAKRLAEHGRQVFVLLDSLTRLARAYNKASNSGRTMSGGMDIRALDVPKKLFGSARVFEEGGSLTILGTALIDTGSRMDEVIFQEFKGTGNMELVLDRKLADRRVFPAIDISQSGTRKEERLLTPETLQRVTLLRRSLVQLHPVQAMEGLVQKLGKTDTNAEFLDKIGAFVK